MFRNHVKKKKNRRISRNIWKPCPEDQKAKTAKTDNYCTHSTVWENGRTAYG